jgi:hypothetical protein
MPNVAVLTAAKYRRHGMYTSCHQTAPGINLKKLPK